MNLFGSVQQCGQYFLSIKRKSIGKKQQRAQNDNTFKNITSLSAYTEPLKYICSPNSMLQKCASPNCMSFRERKNW